MAQESLHIGERAVWGGVQPFGLTPSDRARHLYCVGQTGTGKSTLLRNLLAQDIRAGEGVALIDPHGDLAHEVCDLVPAHRIDDVVVLDPTDTAHVPGFNLFYRVPEDERALVASNITATFKHVWADSWGPRLEYILRNTIRLVLDAPDRLRPSFLSIPRALVETSYRQALLEHATDSENRRFFEAEFDTWPARQQAEALAPVQNKLGAVVANPFVRNIISQWRPTIDLPRIMAAGHILIVRVPKGAVGEDQANLLGSFVVSGLVHAAMHDNHARQPFHLYIDEFQNFTTDSFASILSEARKYALSLTIGHQFTAQIAEPIRAAVFGNVGNIVSFRVGADDAKRLAHEFAMATDRPFQDLRRGEVMARLTYGGEVAAPFAGRTSPHTDYHGTRARVLAKSRRAYTQPRNTVETRIANWLGK